jgi:hypothetical protein
MAELLAFARDKPQVFADGDLLASDPSYATFPFG